MSTAAVEGTGIQISRRAQQEWFRWITEEQFSIRVKSEDVGGAFAIVEAIFPPLFGPPLHLHENETEVFQMLEGTLRFLLDGEVFDASSGDVVIIPQGKPHTFRNRSKMPARVLGVFTPGGADLLFQAVSASPPETIEAVLRKHGTILVGPPLPA